jgi:superfamily I DNA/RNA helicase
MVAYTEEQKFIFDFIQNGTGNGIIDAVAGSGKTTTIMECAQYVDTKSRLLFCAFNNSIANEIASKFRGVGKNQVVVKTMHALGLQILTSNFPERNFDLKNNKYRSLINQEKTRKILKPYYLKLIELKGYSTKYSNDKEKFAVRNYLYKINDKLLNINQKFRSTLCKNSFDDFKHMVIHFGIFNVIDRSKKTFNECLKSYFNAHQILLDLGNQLAKNHFLIDFTDMIYLPFIWKIYPARRFDFLFVDECQDLSKAQLAIALKYGKKEGRILAVGDPSQSIYGFTGADINSFSSVKEIIKAEQLPLSICFRCPIKVIDIAKEIRADINGSKDYNGEVTKVPIDKLADLIKPGDLIISRLKDPLMKLVFKLIKSNVKLKVHPDEEEELMNEIRKLFKKEELRINLHTHFEGIEGLMDTVLKRWEWIINKNYAHIDNYTKRELLIEAEMEFIEEKLNFLEDGFLAWKQDCKSILDILKIFKKFISAKDNAIKLSSIHRAKGLENPRIFILNYDQMPYYRDDQLDWELTQELNLKYVAVTRAMEELFLVESDEIDDTYDDFENDEGSMFDDLF